MVGFLLIVTVSRPHEVSIVVWLGDLQRVEDGTRSPVGQTWTQTFPAAAQALGTGQAADRGLGCLSGELQGELASSGSGGGAVLVNGGPAELFGS